MHACTQKLGFFSRGSGLLLKARQQEYSTSHQLKATRKAAERQTKPTSKDTTRASSRAAKAMLTQTKHAAARLQFTVETTRLRSEPSTKSIASDHPSAFSGGRSSIAPKYRRLREKPLSFGSRRLLTAPSLPVTESALGKQESSVCTEGGGTTQRGGVSCESRVRRRNARCLQGDSSRRAKRRRQSRRSTPAKP